MIQFICIAFCGIITIIEDRIPVNEQIGDWAGVFRQKTDKSLKLLNRKTIVGEPKQINCKVILTLKSRCFGQEGGRGTLCEESFGRVCTC